ncbi:hypothetical protein TPADAL_0608 [Treponema pallidum subsp. pallidum DAL-1]|nr:HEAT repeat domain-containing protein [Treponema pallidum]ADD72714.1 conserved hypothetical protein [Treponema pallidum subsp. pallidum str. Chicago]AEZ57731.1 hypothetical protein TPESAMD_0608 [Treponema pallidum subsp. pertenue str. SamoaD]AEZ58800.1 hypothetical protein TPECDC2_0608 [Treponema pallidum subsp. pertenue str. CDC2]AEZ59868.1 hypothetical protein TPEGAU_0608 [Treponema pallidum subsp. pertenue str. Gauthier]AEZ60929.1 hypothetical protein TPADAL_0608 [Treponema pallidum subs
MQQRFFLLGVCAFAFGVPVFPQQGTDPSVGAQASAGDGGMMTVEQAYLNSAEGVVIKEMVESRGHDSKVLALQYIQEALEGGRGSDDLQEALSRLATAGLFRVIREQGRVINDFPDIRLRACELLARLPSARTKDALIQVMCADREPSVVRAAVKSLGEVGINEQDETTATIGWISRKFSAINPTGSLALEILNTYERLAPTVRDRRAVVESIMDIAADGRYAAAVRARALEVVKGVVSGGK